jgi:hypothetical protein
MRGTLVCEDSFPLSQARPLPKPRFELTGKRALNHLACFSIHTFMFIFVRMWEISIEICYVLLGMNFVILILWLEVQHDTTDGTFRRATLLQHSVLPSPWLLISLHFDPFRLYRCLLTSKSRSRVSLWYCANVIRVIHVGVHPPHL